MYGAAYGAVYLVLILILNWWCVYLILGIVSFVVGLWCRRVAGNCCLSLEIFW